MKIIGHWNNLSRIGSDPLAVEKLKLSLNALLKGRIKSSLWLLLFRNSEWQFQPSPLTFYSLNRLHAGFQVVSCQVHLIDQFVLHLASFSSSCPSPDHMAELHIHPCP